MEQLKSRRTWELSISRILFIGMSAITVSHVTTETSVEMKEDYSRQLVKKRMMMMMMMCLVIVAELSGSDSDGTLLYLLRLW
jgi:hypothetical protein